MESMVRQIYALLCSPTSVGSLKQCYFTNNPLPQMCSHMVCMDTALPPRDNPQSWGVGGPQAEGSKNKWTYCWYHPQLMPTSTSVIFLTEQACGHSCKYSVHTLSMWTCKWTQREIVDMDGVVDLMHAFEQTCIDAHTGVTYTHTYTHTCKKCNIKRNGSGLYAAYLQGGACSVQNKNTSSNRAYENT